MWKDVILWIFLAVNTVMDLKTRKINIVLCVIFGVFGIGVSLCSRDTDWISVAGGMAVGAYLLVFALLTREAVGIGDGFVVTAVGIRMGGGRILAVLMGGFILAAVFGLIKVCAGKANGKSELAFVPFFTLSYVVLYLGGLI